jgi:hypothetical protein
VRKLLVFIFLIGISERLLSQELNCKVDVLSEAIQGTDKHIFESLKTAIYEFMNNRKWTNEAFKNEERIDCNILINITTKVSADEFTGTFQVQSRRPIFKSSYNSTLLNYNDNDFDIHFIDGQTLDYADNASLSNLTSVLAYYAYLIIGMDYDTFSMNGGTPYLQKALAVVNNSQSAAEKGWKAFDGDKNRYWLINNMLDAPFIGIRECMYNYHRKGLDVMVDNKESGRAVILENIEALKTVHQTRPLSFNMQIFFIAKSDEIINIFSGAFPDEKSKLINILNDIDPTNSNKYQKILAAQ